MLYIILTHGKEQFQNSGVECTFSQIYKKLKINNWNTVPSEAKHWSVWIRSTKAVQVILIISIPMKCLTAEDFIRAFLVEDLRAA